LRKICCCVHQFAGHQRAVIFRDRLKGERRGDVAKMKEPQPKS